MKALAVLLLCATCTETTGLRSSWNSSGDVVVFYHIYRVNAKLADAIATEQLEALQKAGDRIKQVRYTIVGGDENHRYECEKCHKVAHHAAGDENLSLDALRSHCLAHGSEHVAYMHSKGSYHPSGRNDRFRRFLMQGILSEQCLSLPRSCDVCASRISSTPHLHPPGNMWVASCDYIRHLLAPAEFIAVMQRIASTSSAPPVFRPDWALGTGRFSNEHWVLSHPDVVPCDVCPVESYIFGYNLPMAPWQPTLSVGPRFPARSYLAALKAVLPMPNISAYRAWRVDEWKALYDKIPPAGSWQWSLFG